MEKQIVDYKELDQKYCYNKEDLGCTYTKNQTQFKVWAPTAENVEVLLYQTGDDDTFIKKYAMKKGEKGVWEVIIEKDLENVYYTYLVTNNKTTSETVDPYAKAVGVNGVRGMVIDLKKTDPEGFLEDKRPACNQDTDAIIYEIHVRDLSMDANAGITNKGKFKGFCETGTKNAQGLSTGLDHIKDLGVTHIHLLPSYDFKTIDESNLKKQEFNWGYDPENYNVPEGSYSSDPFHAEVRIKEFKEMVQTLHQNGLRVVMDVVYNHTFSSIDSCFHKVQPYYYHRVVDGTFSNGSDCGNETASDHLMFRKYMIDSLKYWAKEYHIDGFRFDLMALHDIETMNEIRKELDKIDKSILLYGEGWTGGPSILPEEKRASKANTAKLNRIACFSDDMRDAIKGSVFIGEEAGFVSGKLGVEKDIQFGIVAATNHPQVTGKKAWTNSPAQCITYTSVHDNFTLWDKLCISRPDATKEDKIRMNMLSAAIVLSSQGIPLFQAGEEILRSKPISLEDNKFDHNSYKSSDEINAIKWENKSTYQNVYNYYKGLIAFRKQHKGLSMQTELDIQKHLRFMENLQEQVVGYYIDGSPNKESAKKIAVIFNASNQEVKVTLDHSHWSIYVNDEFAGTEILGKITDGIAVVKPISAMILVLE